MTEQVLLLNRQPDRPLTLDEYRAQGGYQALLDTVGKRTPEEVLQAVLDARLEGPGRGLVSHRQKVELHRQGQPPLHCPQFRRNGARHL